MMDGLSRRWARLRELFPVTNLGVGVLLLAAIAYWEFGVPRVDYVVQLVAILAMALVGAAIIVVLLGTYLTHRAVKRYVLGEGGAAGASSREGPLTFEAHRGFAVALKIPRRGWFPLLEVSWTWEHPEDFVVETAIVEGELWENVETHRRTFSGRIVRRFLIEDSFGLARIVFRADEPRLVRVVPFSGNLDRAPILRSLAAGEDLPHPSGTPDGDRVDMRRYVPGDPLRLALWKVYARTRQLMVRTPERAIAPAVRVVAYQVAAVGDEPAAAAARLAVDAGLLGADWLFGADGATAPTQDRDTAVEMILRSRNTRGTDLSDAASLMSFVQQASDAEPVRLVLFVPAIVGPWLERTCETLRRHSGSASAVIVTDGVIDPDQEGPGRFDRILRIPDDEKKAEEAITTSDQLLEVARALRAAGAEVTAVDRVQGRALGLGLSSGISQAEYQGALRQRVA